MGEVFIDWSKAPEGTTHAVIEGQAIVWEKIIDSEGFIFRMDEMYSMWRGHTPVCNAVMSNRIARPTEPVGSPESTIHDPNVPGYEKLRDVLERAYNQAAKGKGAERHGKDFPFHLQPMQQIADMYGIGFMLGQVAKKIEEAQRLPKDRAINEILGAINYCAGAVIFLEKQELAAVTSMTLELPKEPNEVQKVVAAIKAAGIPGRVIHT